MQAFLEDYGYNYIIINPLKAKKEMNLGLCHNKNGKNDTYYPALIQRLYNQPINKIQINMYHQLNVLRRFYDQLTSDLVIAKRSLH